MNDLRDILKNVRDELSLSTDERASIRAAIEAHAARQEMGLVTLPTPSPFIWGFTAQWTRLAALALVLIVAGGGTSLAAEGALPGDILYPVKVSFNEKVERTFAFSSIAKADLDIQHAEERLREVELLAAKGDEDMRDVDVIADDIEARVARAHDVATALSEEGEAEDADRIRSRIDAALAAHADILEAQAEDEEEEGRRRLRALSVAVSIAADDMRDEVRNEDAARDDGSEENEALEERIARAREASARARIAELTEELGENGVPEDTVTELSVELASIEAEFGEARALIAEGDYDEAGDEYEDVERRAYRSLTLLSSAKRISDTTGKEVFISLDGEEPPMESAEDTAAGTMMFMATTAEEDEDEANAKRASDGPKLRFFVRDRDENSN